MFLKNRSSTRQDRLDAWSSCVKYEDGTKTGREFLMVPRQRADEVLLLSESKWENWNVNGKAAGYSR